MDPLLSLIETRVLGVLVEKQRSVPDTYPLTLNALTAGCNQKTSRDPIMSIPESDVQATIDRLKRDAWIVESSGGRVMRYAHNVERVLNIPTQSVALLAVLMLRGPQTAAELRANSDRLHRFADVSAVEAFLNELAARSGGALVVELPRAPGTRETRWAHLLSGPPANVPAAPRALPVDASTDAAELGALRDEVAALRSEVESLRSEVTELRAQIGSSRP